MSQDASVSSDDETSPENQTPDLGALTGGLDLGGLMEQAQAMMSQAQAAGDTVVEGSAGGGAVKITVTGMGRFDAVSIDPAAVDPDDVETLEDLVLAALHDCNQKIAALQAGSVGDFDLGSIGDLLGGVIDTDATE